MPASTTAPAAISEQTRWLTPAQASEYLQLDVSTLERHRRFGSGPSYYKLGSGKSAPIRYERESLDRWVIAHVTISSKPSI